jgi:formate/nitrite transporter FocA (FNT family)
MRTVISCAVLVVAIPAMAWMFLKNGVSIPYTIAISLVILMGAGARLTTDILMVVPKIKGQVKRLQNLDLIGALLRVGLIGVLYLTTMNAFTAVLTASLASYIQNLWLMKRGEKRDRLGRASEPRR